MADPRTALSDPRVTLSDPRMSLSEARVSLTVCTCGLPNCPRVGPHAGAPHPAGFSPEGHYAHGLPVPLGSAPVGHIDPTVLYSMQGAYGLKDGPEMMRTLPQLNGYYPYDPASVYPYMNGYGGIDARRKNATKESTNTLKAWLFEHRKNPYPTKGEKIMLAILTKMTLTQVSTWFANARRRLKKENKMTWTSKDDIDGDDEDESEHSGDVTDRANISAASGSTEDGRQLKGTGSVGDDDDDVLSVTSVGDRSDIDVEDHSDINDDHRIPALLPHTMGPSGPHPMFLANHGPHMFSPLMTSLDKNAMPLHRNGDLSGNTAAPGSNQSQKLESTVQRPLSPVSPCNNKCNHVATITPPPSPRDARMDQSSPSSRMTSPHGHRSSATIHHHPVTISAGAGRAHIPPASAQSPSKPKIWSIADVVSSKDSNDNNENTKSQGYTSRSSHTGNSPPAIVTVGGAPSRMDHIPRGMPHPHAIPASIPGSESGYSLAYYPYGFPNPAAAAAIMASQASHLSSRVHPYSRLGGFPGHPASMPHHLGYTVAQSRPEYHGGLPNVSRPSSDTHTVSAIQKQPLDSQKALEASRKPGAPRPVVSTAPSNCTPTAFTPVVQRQM